MAAFVPRALTKPQKVPLPGKLVRKAGGLVDKRSFSKDVNATGKAHTVGQVDVLSEEGRGGVAERAPSHWQASSSGRGTLDKKRMGLAENQGLEDEDDGPEVLQIEKNKQQAKRRRVEPQCDESNALESAEVRASKKSRDVLNGASSKQVSSDVAEVVSEMGMGQSATGNGVPFEASEQIRKETVGAPADDSVTGPDETPASRENVDSDLHNVQTGAVMIENDCGGGRTNGVAGKGAGKQRDNYAKKVFPYGNYNRYYGYRFAKTLSEDPRLSLFQKEWFQGKACLDVGCNEGYVTIAVAQKFECGSMVGVDIDGSLVAKAKSHLKREAAILRQANKPQRARLELAGQADHPGVRQTLLWGTQSSRSPEGPLRQEKRRRLAQGYDSGHPPESDIGETGRRVVSSTSEQVSTVGGFEVVGEGGGDGSGRGADEAADVSSRGANGSADVSGEESGRVVVSGVPEQTADGTLGSLGEASLHSRFAQEGEKPEGLGLVGLTEGENGDVKEDVLLETVMLEGKGEGMAEGTLDERETEGEVSTIDPPASEATGFLSSEVRECLGGGSALERKRFSQNVQFRKENFVVSPVEEEKYDVVMSLSVVKWIHLNWGDDGLLRFFSKVYKSLKPGGLFILEPQPWKSYKSNRAVSETTQRHFKEIKILPDQFSNVLQSKIGFRSADIVTPAVPGSIGGFGRAIYLYRK
ncbi:hypothetical protein KFL_000340380 [Klebsormidium nitens]|uniref:RNA methyltransferase n=1 Tax=Klebsormidium nitens TaxID=105231 RepID=A0A1Y1HSU9_KLENI|nr:hypothetical protein KFL_000340380 [Klebsormidium nitens]|eukprot:GAQ79636.1 hypothetical protein KFL_000340380 [Klebsormidium nitens]